MTTAKILLLESDRTSVTSFASALEKRGYAVTIEHNMQSATKRAQALGPDIVVLDAASLKTSGARICRRLRAYLNGMPILLIADQKSLPDSNCGASAM
ncbi:MAG: response regulator, partial [Anaerolineales bacterium]